MERSSNDRPIAETFFIAIPLPERIHNTIEAAIVPYEKNLQRTVPPEKWHITLLWLGHIPLSDTVKTTLMEALTHTFVPTITITHIGQGLVPTQLWAYIQTTKNLHDVRMMLLDRCKTLSLPQDTTRLFTPHITVGTFAEPLPMAIPDYPIFTQFTVSTIELMCSIPAPNGRNYRPVGKIQVT